MTNELTARDVFDLQLREVSGICERRPAVGGPGSGELLHGQPGRPGSAGWRLG